MLIQTPTFGVLFLTTKRKQPSQACRTTQSDYLVLTTGLPELDYYDCPWGFS